MKKQILVLAPYFPSWQYYTYFFYRLQSEKDPLIKSFDIKKDFDVKPSDFKKYSAIVLMYHDPLKQLYPEIYHSAQVVYNEAIRRGISFVNDPLSLSNTSKSIQGAIWRKNKIPCANCWAFKDFEDLVSQNPKFPLFLRYDSGHDSKGNFYSKPIANVDELVVTFNEFGRNLINRFRFAEPVAIEWIDTKDKEGIYRKYRVYIFGDTVLNGNLASSKKWYMHFHDRITDEWALREHHDFMFGEPHNSELMIKATSALGLSINAIDYSKQRNNELILWESNPHPSFGAWLEPNEEYQNLFMNSLKNFFRKYLVTR